MIRAFTNHRRRAGRAACAAVMMAASTVPYAADDTRVATQWVASLPDGGIYTDGYASHDPPRLSTDAGQRRMVPAAVIEYYQRAWQDFLDLKGLTERQRDPRHYKIGHELDGRTLTVVVQGLRLPRIVDGEPVGILRVSIGPSLRLRYDLDSGRLIDKHRLR